jgi:hypothetical protein
MRFRPRFDFTIQRALKLRALYYAPPSVRGPMGSQGAFLFYGHLKTNNEGG